ncbi:Putative Ergosterol biosynthesis protein Erg28 [Aspergillus calidoustus]|uniref:Putative Ergosterol biosynthesis protein Erg28 n=1 Tax=Aspergillus calidoustus TaxID=454130 RepID=A0A0U5FQJ2_ASPCI|nr:Putative Ergosterol biosynthesis protein Erg28 [Aspergillus calidoustus]
MDQLLSYLPPFDGLLPKWLALVSVISAANSFQAYFSEAYTAQLYNGRLADGSPHSNALSSRLFGTWTLLSAFVRFAAAYNITNPVVYDLATCTFGLALLHFVGEWLGFGSAQLKGRFVSPLIVASSTLTWMLTQREAYLGA